MTETPVGPDPTVRYYGAFAEDGSRRGFWISDIFPPDKDGNRNAKIPEEAIEITNDEWLALMNDPIKRYIGGEIVEGPQPMPSSQYYWGPTLVDVVGVG